MKECLVKSTQRICLNKKRIQRIQRDSGFGLWVHTYHYEGWFLEIVIFHFQPATSYLPRSLWNLRVVPALALNRSLRNSHLKVLWWLQGQDPRGTMTFMLILWKMPYKCFSSSTFTFRYRAFFFALFASLTLRHLPALFQHLQLWTSSGPTLAGGGHHGTIQVEEQPHATVWTTPGEVSLEVNFLGGCFWFGGGGAVLVGCATLLHPRKFTWPPEFLPFEDESLQTIIRGYVAAGVMDPLGHISLATCWRLHFFWREKQLNS